MQISLIFILVLPEMSPRSADLIWNFFAGSAIFFGSAEASLRIKDKGRIGSPGACPQAAGKRQARSEAIMPVKLCKKAYTAAFFTK